MSDVEEGRNGGHGFFWFVVGMIFGVAGAILVPRFAAPYLPSFLRGATGVEGQVLEKVSESDRMLIKVSTPEGLILATFTQNLRELDLLIGQGDTITLGLDGYETLVEDPPVGRVIRSTMSEDPAGLPSPGEGMESEQEEGTMEESGPSELEEETEESMEDETPPPQDIGEEATEPEIDPEAGTDPPTESEDEIR